MRQTVSVMNDKSVIPVMVNGADIRDTRGREYADYYYDPGQISGIWPDAYTERISGHDRQRAV